MELFINDQEELLEVQRKISIYSRKRLKYFFYIELRVISKHFYGLIQMKSILKLDNFHLIFIFKRLMELSY